MSGITIEVDIEALVHRQWGHMPWRYRWLWLIPGARRRIEAQAVSGMRSKGAAWAGNER